MSARSEALTSLSVAIGRTRGDSIPLSAETAKALGLKGRSISTKEAVKLLAEEPSGEEDSAEDGEAGSDPASGGKSKTKSRRTKPANEGEPASTDPLA